VIVKYIMLGVYGFGCVVWLAAVLRDFARILGWPVLLCWPIFVPMAFLWPVLRCRSERKDESWILRVFA
jgi:hypothetical protein